jgi:hypothetical protein
MKSAVQITRAIDQDKGFFGFGCRHGSHYAQALQ